MSDNSFKNILLSLTKEISHYIGISEPIVSVNHIQDLNDSRFLVAQSGGKFVINYGNSSGQNTIALNYLNYEDAQNLSKYNGGLKINFSYLLAKYIATIRHECQHLKQMALTANYLNGKKVSEFTKLIGILSYADFCNNYFRINVTKEKEKEFGITYLSKLVEYDARKSEINFFVELIRSGELLPKAQLALEYYIYMQLDDFSIFSNYKSIKEFVKVNSNIIMSKFKTNFMQNENAHNLIKEFEQIDLDEVLKCLDNQEKYFEELKLKYMLKFCDINNLRESVDKMIGK